MVFKAPLVVLLGLVSCLSACTDPSLTDQEKKIFSSFSLSRLPPPQTESNLHANNPKAAKLGSKLFTDARLSSTGTVSCITCHQPEKHFTDGLVKGQGIGKLNRNTPSLAGAAWNQWQYWDGRRDSLWSQALAPLEAANEMGSNRVAVARLMTEDAEYRQQYVALFGAIRLQKADLTIDASPIGSDKQRRAWFDIDASTQDKINTVFANVGKSIGAFEQTLPPVKTRFDRFVDNIRLGKPYDKILSKTELQGARLFIDSTRTQCLECHHGPLLSNGDFHNIGTGRFDARPGEQLDFGRVFGVQAAMINDFNCQGRFSDADKDQCNHLRFLNRNAVSHSQGAFRTPTLRNVANTAPYFHDGRFATLEQVVQHYAMTPAVTPAIAAATPAGQPVNTLIGSNAGQNELRPFALTSKEIEALTAFLNSLTAEDL